MGKCIYMQELKLINIACKNIITEQSLMYKFWLKSLWPKMLTFIVSGRLN